MQLFIVAVGRLGWGRELLRTCSHSLALHTPDSQLFDDNAASIPVIVSEVME